MSNPTFPSQKPCDQPRCAGLALAPRWARVTYDRVGGGWHPAQQWTDRVSFSARSGETDEQATLRVFQFDHHPQARVLRIEVLPNIKT